MFHVDSDSGNESAPVAPGPSGAKLEEVPASRSMLLSWRNLQHVIGKLVLEGPLVPLTVPVSPRLQRVLKNYGERGGFTGMLRGVKPRPTVEPPVSEETAETARCTDFLHTNGCGDFTLIAGEHWFDLRGYPELDIFSMNIDSVFCFAAHYGGAREEVLPEPMRI